MINIDEVHRLVSIFYQPEFKTFYVNSVDGEKFTMPTGVFVSLGITTSMEVLNSIKDVINTSDEYSAELVEIVSKRVSGIQYMNLVTKIGPTQYKAQLDEKTPTFGKVEAEEELERLRKESGNFEVAPAFMENINEITSLKRVIDKLDQIDGGWENHRIIKRSDGYGFYHLHVNYEKRDGLEYRVGIYVTPKNEGKTN